MNPVLHEVAADDTCLFGCPECDVRIVVDPGIREILIADGCVICNADVSRDDFDRLD
jgi:hypothetical protein